jgi:hypothetical protein
LFIVVGMLAGLVGQHASQTRHGGRLERWGFRASLLGLLLLTSGALAGYWPPLLHFSFVAFILPGLLLLVVGSPLFGLGTWRAGVAPRIGAGLLTVGGPAVLLISQIATLGGGLVLMYLAWVVLGHSLWSATPTPTHTVASSSAPSRPDQRQA